MSETADVSVLVRVRPELHVGRFDRVSIGFHWAVVLLVVGQLTTAWLRSQMGEHAPNAAALLTVHRSMGLVTWAVAAARLVWRRAFAHLPPFPATMPKLQQSIAKSNEYGLYALLLLQPLTGLGAALLRGRSVGLFFWKVPALAPSVEPAFHAFHMAHEIGAIALLALVGLHASAALFHTLVRRDGVMGRMLPWTAS